MTEVVTLENVSRIYPGPPETFALKHCTLGINEGDFVTIAGPSGSGKSTLLNVLGLLDTPSSGRYLLRGEDVSLLNEKQRAAVRGQQIGFVFQSFQLLDGRSCLENVMLADLYAGASKSDSQRAAHEALSAVRLGQRASSLVGELSGGQKQRVAIARALLGKPTILLCDEPTGNLDSKNAKTVLELFQEINRNGVTVALITYDPQIAALGNRQLTIFDGVVAEAQTQIRGVEH